MKKIVFIMVLTLSFAFAVNSWATWTLASSVVKKSGHYVKWKVLCTSDGSALSATDILTVANGMPASLRRNVQGQTLMKMKVSPGIGGVIPNATINITLTDDEDDSLWADTGISKDAISWHDMSKDINIYIPITGKLYLAINDLGDSGDQVTLYFITWYE